MSKIEALRHEFVEFIPRQVEDGVLYVSLEYATARHNCCCGCGMPVVTPLSPNDWQLIFDGRSVSLYPSIGNWSFPCRSHYWIDRGRVRTAHDWSDSRIEAARTASRLARLGDPDSEPESDGDDDAGVLSWLWRR